MSPQIRITRNHLYPGTISRGIYGEFIEFLNDLIPGMWAEMVRDRSFEGLSQSTCFYREEKEDFTPAWRQIQLLDTTHETKSGFNVIFDRDSVQPFVGSQSARIRVVGGGIFLAGIAQDRVSVQRGDQLNLELYMRGETVGAKVHVFIGRDYGSFADFYDEVVFDSVDGTWRQFKGILDCQVTDLQACFVIALDGPGTLWVDKVSLMPSDNLGGWRSDVVNAIKATRPGVIRFGGSSLIYYDWRQGIGPREQRVPFVNTPWNNMEENDVGLDEFLHFCELVNAQPLICVNANSSTPQDIAEQVEYVNGAGDSGYGLCRSANGHLDPYGVKYWQVGNEQHGDDYETNLLKYVSEMKGVDPSIKVLASYPSDRIINELGHDVDFICPHYYGPDIAEFVRETERLRSVISASLVNPALKLGITEWNHTAGDWGELRVWLQTIQNGIFVARMFNHFQRNGDLIRIANRSNLVNSCYSGSIQTRSRSLYFTPAYHVQKLYATLSGQVAVNIEVDSNDLDICGTMDEDATRFMVWVVNPSERAIETQVSVAEIGVVDSLRYLVIAGASPTSINSFERKDNVAPIEEFVTPAPIFRRKFPAYSVTGMELKMAT